MKSKSTFSAIGGYQPLLFCIGMYFVALFFSIFICSAIFYAVNPGENVMNNGTGQTANAPVMQTGKQVLLTVTSK